MHAVAVNVAPEVMASTMQDLFPVAGLFQNRPGGPIHLPAPYIRLGARRFLSQLGRRIPRRRHRIEGTHHGVRDVSTGKPYPGYIGINRSRVTLLRFMPI